MRNRIHFFMITAILFAFGCSKTPLDTKGSSQAVKNSETYSEVNGAIITVPDSIPPEIDDIAVTEAIKYGYDGIRILMETIDNDSKYFVSFFNDGEDFDREILISQDGQVESLNDLERNYLNKASVEISLKKSSSTLFSICWSLATFYENTNQSGTSFRFSQTTTSNGWFHKIIYSLGVSQNCCEQNYTGNLNDKISSHVWYVHVQSGHATSPHSTKVRAWGFKYGETNLSGPAYTFSGSECLEYDNYANKTYNQGYPQGDSLNDTVSCIDMLYLVYTQ